MYDRPFGTGFCTSCFICRDDSGNATNKGNNNKSTICLSNEVKETNNLLGKSYSQKTDDLITQIEIPPSIPTDRCNIM